MQPEARKAYSRLLSQGWTDAARHLHPDKRMYTYWTTENAFRQNKGMRLDFVLLKAGLCAAQRSAQVATNAGGSMRHFEEATNPAIMHRCGLNLPIRTRNARQPERGARAGRGKVGLIHRRSKQP